MNKLDELELFEATDQPETCRYCGRRTEFMELLNSKKQIHHCAGCDAVYVVEE